MHRQSAFTLIEIMVVVVILGILAALVVPELMQRPEQARMVKVKQDILAIENALQLYRMDNGVYPSTDQGLQALVNRPQIDPVPDNWQLYLKAMPKDPWGHTYQYLNPGSHGEIDIFTQHAEKTLGNWNATN